MAKINFVDHTGETRTIDVENGATVMEAAIRNAIPGIEAECGGGRTDGDRRDPAPVMIPARRSVPANPSRRFSLQPLARSGSTRYRTARTRHKSLPAARVIMAKISFVDHTGETRIIDVENGATVMEAAIRNAIPGIEAECGGACACATCHVYVDEAWRDKVGGPSPMEEDMLDFGFDVRPNSRLSCQIKVSDELDGLVVSTPERQA